MTGMGAAIIVLLIGIFSTLLAGFILAAMGKLWFKITFGILCSILLCYFAVSVERHIKSLPSETKMKISKKTLHSGNNEDNSSLIFAKKNFETRKIEQKETDDYYERECRSGWFKASNVETELKLSCLRENESFEISCPVFSPKANGMCLVKWFIDGKPAGEIIIHYKDGEQTSVLSQDDNV